MTDVNSKNMYALLGNDPEYDSDREPEPPTKAVEKPAARPGKRDGPAEKPVDAAPAAAAGAGAGAGGRGGRGGGRGRGDGQRRRGGFTDDEYKFRENTSRSRYNRDNPVENANDDGQVRGRDSGPGTQRRGRGQAGPRRGGDRHSRTGKTDDQKQVGHGWGAETAEAEQADEMSGERQAQQEIKEEGFDATATTGAELAEQTNNLTVDDNAEPAEPEDKSKSYADYLAERQAKRDAALGIPEARKANEGAKDNKKWAQAQELSKSEGEAYFEGEAKRQRERERTRNKNVLDIDYSFKEERRDDRGGRGGGRGRGRGRGEGRGEGRGDFRPRGDRGDRGGFRGDRGDRPRRGDGERRGGRGGHNADQPAISLGEDAFPSLGGK